MTLNRRIVSVLLCGALVAPLGQTGAALASQTTPADAALAVTGFQGEWSPTSKIADSAEALTTVGVDGVVLISGGRNVSSPSADARRQLKVTHEYDLSGEILISNYDEQIGDFNEEIAYELLRNRRNIDRVVASLVEAVQDQGWDGVSTDIEALLRRDRAGMITFARALDEALPAGKTLSINIPVRDSVAGYRRAGFDVAPLAAIVDRVILMAYDQHGPWDPEPGPIGALEWQQAGLDALLEAVPAKQIDLGVAGYGYGWRPKKIITMSDAKARLLVERDGATAEWDAAAGEWTATLSDGSILWWSDARSYKLRYELAEAYGLHGLAVWSLGQSDPIEPPGGATG